MIFRQERRMVRSLFAVLLTCALFLSGCNNRVDLLASIAEAEANEVLAELQKAGISAHKIPGKEGMVGVSIEARQVGRSVDLLRAKGLPRERHAGMGEVFKKEGLISSPLEERARYIFALSQELASTIAQIDGVIVARVHVVLPERAAPGETSGTQSTAAVFIKHQDGYNLDTVLPQVRRLVTNSIPGLSAERVSVVLVSAQSLLAVSTSPVSGSALPTHAVTLPPVSPPLTQTLPLIMLAIVAVAGTGFISWKYWWRRRKHRSVAA